MKNKWISALIGFALLIGCNPPQIHQPADFQDNLSLNTPLILEEGENILYLEDYILTPSDIDSVSLDIPTQKIELSADKRTATVTINSFDRPLSNLLIRQKGVSTSVLCKKSNKVRYTFTFDPKGEKYKTVQVIGQMNDWNKGAANATLTLNESGLYQGQWYLAPGGYQYQICLDGKCDADPNCSEKIDNFRGQFNSIFKIQSQQGKQPSLSTEKIDNNSIFLKSSQTVDQLYVYWQNYLLPAALVTINQDDIIIRIPKEADALSYSHIRVFAATGNAISNDILIPLKDGKVVTDAFLLPREDKHAQIIYSLMVDRFENGNKTNDQPLNRSDVNPKVDYFGGDIAGITQVIESGYFDSLGVNTLWISPINQNPLTPYGSLNAPYMKTKFSGYHGYWPISSSKIDYRFGTPAEMKQMVNTAHENQMNVLLDYVANHVHQEHPLFKEHPTWVTPLILPDGTKNLEKWDEHRLTTWFDTFLPTLDYANDTLTQIMTDSALLWITEYDIDGYRHDACKHVPENFWRTLNQKIRKQIIVEKKKPFYQIGETYGSNELIGSYVNTGKLDGQFDFNVFDDAVSAFAQGGVSLDRLKENLYKSLDSYGYHNLMGYITGNHDRARFTSLASGEVSFSEDSKAAGWKREIKTPQAEGYHKLLLLTTFNMTIPGIPVIYYGDEIGLWGANDPDCRKMMRFGKENWSPEEQSLHSQVTKITRLRKNNIALQYGSFTTVEQNEQTWIYLRSYFDKQVFVLINNAKEEKTFKFKAEKLMHSSTLSTLFGRSYDVDNGEIIITLPALSTEVIYN